MLPLAETKIRLVITLHFDDISSNFSYLSLLLTGLDCQFLQGDATEKSEITKFWQDLSKSDGYASLEILNYNKYNTLHHNSLYCFPLIDNCGPDDAPQVSHIAVVLTGSYEVHHSAQCSDLLEGRALEEVGMPLDRREGYVQSVRTSMSNANTCHLHHTSHHLNVLTHLFIFSY